MGWYSQLLPEPPDLGLGVGELHAQVLPALGALHAGGAAGRLRRTVRQEAQAVPLLRQLDDGLGTEHSKKSTVAPPEPALPVPLTPHTAMAPQPWEGLDHRGRSLSLKQSHNS